MIRLDGSSMSLWILRCRSDAAELRSAGPLPNQGSSSQRRLRRLYCCSLSALIRERACVCAASEACAAHHKQSAHRAVSEEPSGAKRRSEEPPGEPTAHPPSNNQARSAVARNAPLQLWPLHQEKSIKAQGVESISLLSRTNTATSSLLILKYIRKLQAMNSDVKNPTLTPTIKDREKL